MHFVLFIEEKFLILHKPKALQQKHFLDLGKIIPLCFINECWFIDSPNNTT
jgi:hypothetical protein